MRKIKRITVLLLSIIVIFVTGFNLDKVEAYGDIYSNREIGVYNTGNTINNKNNTVEKIGNKDESNSIKDEINIDDLDGKAKGQIESLYEN